MSWGYLRISIDSQVFVLIENCSLMLLICLSLAVYSCTQCYTNNNMVCVGNYDGHNLKTKSDGSKTLSCYFNGPTIFLELLSHTMPAKLCVYTTPMAKSIIKKYISTYVYVLLKIYACTYKCICICVCATTSYFIIYYFR